MAPWPRTLSDPLADAAWVRRARYGVIECGDGEFHRLRLRCWPKRVAIDEVSLWGPLWRRFDRRDRCRLFYNQPLGHGDYLSLVYLVSAGGCELKTLVSALTLLDQIAAIKQSAAIVCQAWNPRLTARLLARYGWTPHTPDPRGRHFIKRFYGEYPAARREIDPANSRANATFSPGIERP